MAQLARFRPWVVGMQLTQLEFMAEMQQGVGQGPALAKVIGSKPKTGLLTFEQAAGAFAGAAMEDQVQIVVDVLGKLKEWDAAGKKPNSEWAEAYLSGDLDAIYAAWEQDMTGESDDLNKRLIKAMYDDYVDLMATKIAEQVGKGDKSYGIPVSSYLLGGPNSLIKALEAKGLKLKRIGE